MLNILPPAEFAGPVAVFQLPSHMGWETLFIDENRNLFETGLQVVSRTFLIAHRFEYTPKAHQTFFHRGMFGPVVV